MTTPKKISLDLAAARERLAAGGEPFWRGLDELAQTEAFQEMLHREFPDQASEWANPLTRRRFLALAGASIALAGGMVGCAPQAPPEKIVPYVKQPEQIVPGKPLFFATAMALGGTAIGLLVESHEGRPTKVEGNPSHPASLGATDLYAQAAVLGLYDPDRSGSVTYLGRPRGWEAASLELRKGLADQRSRKGAGLRILTGAVASPTLADQLERVLKDYPEAKWFQYDPLTGFNEADGSRLAFGRQINTCYNLDKADVIVSLDADFLSCGEANLRYSRQYAARRKVWQEKAPEMNRLYVVEGTPSVTGSVADHHIRLRTGLVESFARALAAELHRGIGGDATLADVEAGPALPDEAAKAVGPIARDLLKYRGKGRCAVLAGYAQPPAVHALAHAMNQALGNVGQTVFHTDPIIPPPADSGVAKRAKDGPAGLRELVGEMNGGAVEMLFILGANPVFTAPADLDFRAALEGLSRRKAFTIHHGLYQDETAEVCQWHVPETHFLESWSDARAFNGVASIVQPLIAPLFGGRSAHDILEVFMQGTQRPAYEIVRAYWAAHRPKGEGTFDQFWRRSLNDGVMEGTELPAKPAMLQEGWSAKNLPVSGAAAATPDNLEIVFRPDPTLYDGRFANNGWLQELPRPLSRLTWDNAAFLSPKTAEKLGLDSHFKLGYHGGEHGQMFAPVVEITYQGRTERFPAWIMPSHADDAVTLHLGAGRTRAGRVGTTDGRFNPYKLRTGDLPWFFWGARIARTSEEFTLACVQAHHAIADEQTAARHIVRATTYEKFTADPHSATRVPGEKEGESDGRMPLTLYGDEWKYPRYRWGMAIDLSSCTGCSACVIACQAENNIPVVGKEEVTRGREMHWIRVDRFYAGNDLDNPETFHQPVPCQQCENAPCELVCPVGATAHSHDGLNDMTYNRCVGTRYCSNNCPYKVRRFNFLDFSRERFEVPTLKMLSNPDVTVRSRGVMEKCTYCVQRIREADIRAEKRGLMPGAKEGDGRIRDGEVLTACQAVCPAEAIVFGDMNDEKSRVHKMKETPLDYGILADLNTRPRTTYLAAVRNPNPEMA